MIFGLGGGWDEGETAYGVGGVRLVLSDHRGFGARRFYIARQLCVREAVRSTIERLIRLFAETNGGVKFRDMLKSNRAVISGSMALFPMTSCNFSGTDSSGTCWSPKDMDIYEPDTGKESGVLRYQSHEEF
jgi:hypothetical protein